MHRRSILYAVTRDLKRLSIGALEAFVLSQVDDASTAEQIAEATGLEIDELLKLARHLAEIGAVSVDRPKARTKRPAPLRRTEFPSAPPPSSAKPASLVPDAIAPVARPVADLRSLGISAREGFILSQIDGVTSTAELIAITHLSARDVSDALHALEAAGAIELPHRKNRVVDTPAKQTSSHPSKAPSSHGMKAASSPVIKAPSSRSMKAVSSSSMKAASSRAMKRASSRAMKAVSTPTLKRASSRAMKAVSISAMKAATSPTLKPATASEQRLPDVSEADRALIAEDAARIVGLDHYGVLGVDRTAETKAIRRAYHALAAKFHPDRFFGKNLGPSRQPLERIFGRLTLAYETLSKKTPRDEYDLTLPPREAQAVAIAAPPPAAAVAIAAPPPSPPPAAIAVPAAPRPPPPVVVSRPAVAPPVVAPPPAVAPPVIAPPPVVARPSVPPVVVPAPAESVRRQIAPRQRIAAQDHVDVFIRAAKDALDRGDLSAAANNYRLAAQCSDDPAIHAALVETDAKARTSVRNASLAAAHAAEQGGRWTEAAAKYVKAHGAMPEPWIAERAANALRREGADLRRAAQLGEQAVLAEPNNATFHVTLGEIYLDAGLMARAVGESTRAIALAPKDPRAIALARLVAKVKLA